LHARRNPNSKQQQQSTVVTVEMAKQKVLQVWLKLQHSNLQFKHRNCNIIYAIAMLKFIEAFLLSLLLLRCRMYILWKFMGMYEFPSILFSESSNSNSKTCGPLFVVRISIKYALISSRALSSSSSPSIVLRAFQ